MPITKNALQRYKTLDECFSDPYGKYTFHDLMDMVAEELNNKCGVDKGISKRQLRADLKIMADNGAPIYVKDRAKMNEDGKLVPIYYYGDITTGERVDYRYFGSTVSQEARETIAKTVELLKLYQDLPGFGWIEDITAALEIEFDERSRQNFVSFERNPDLKGLKWLTTLIKHTMGHQPLRVTYIPFHGERRKINFHPYHLKQYNNRWFLWGLDEERNTVSNLALDRIDNFVEIKGHSFIKNDRVEFSSFFDEVIGVTVPETPTENIVLKFTEERLPYVENKPIHPTQRRHPDIANAVTLQLKINRELEARILNYGPDVEVIAPESLRRRIAEKARQMMRMYFPECDMEEK